MPGESRRRVAVLGLGVGVAAALSFGLLVLVDAGSATIAGRADGSAAGSSAVVLAPGTPGGGPAEPALAPGAREVAAAGPRAAGSSEARAAPSERALAPGAREGAAPGQLPATTATGEAVAAIASHALIVVKGPDGEPIEGALVEVVVDRAATADDVGDLAQRPEWTAGAAHPVTDTAGRAVLALPRDARGTSGARYVAYARAGTAEGASAPFGADRWRVEVVAAPPDPPPPGLGALVLRVQAGRQAHLSAPMSVALARQGITMDGRYREAGAGRVTVRGATDGHGDFAIGRLPTGAYDLVVSSPGWADVRMSVVVEAVTVRLVVALDEPDRTVTGPLVPPAGVEPRGVRITVVTELGDVAGEGLVTADGERAWRAATLPPGEHVVVAEVPGHQPRWAKVVVLGARELPSGPPLSWQGSGSVRGRVVHDVGGRREPLAGAPLVLALRDGSTAVTRPRPPFVNRIVRPGRPRATAEARERRDARPVSTTMTLVTDAAGRFEARGLAPGAYLLSGPWRAPFPLSGAGDVDLGDLLADAQEEVAPPRVVVLLGRVVWPGGDVRDATVTLDSGSGLPLAEARADERGRFSLRVEGAAALALGGPVVLGASAQDASGARLFGRVRLASLADAARGAALTGEAVVAPTDLEVTLERAARLRGRVVLPPGLAGRAGAFTWWPRSAPARAASGALAPDGAWDAGFVPAGVALVVAFPGLDVDAEVTLEPGEERALEADLSDRTGEVVVALEGAPDPLAHATAVARWRDGAVRSPVHRGRGVIPGLPRDAGQVEVAVEVEEPRTGTFWRARREVAVSPAGVTVVAFDLPTALGDVRGVVVGRAGTGETTTVRARGDGGAVREAEVVCRDTGEFLLALPAGRWTVSVGDAGSGASVDVLQGRRVDVSLER